MINDLKIHIKIDGNDVESAFRAIHSLNYSMGIEEAMSETGNTIAEPALTIEDHGGVPLLVDENGVIHPPPDEWRGHPDYDFIVEVSTPHFM